MGKDLVSEEVSKLKDEMTETLMDLVRIPAMAPQNGGDGEYKRAEKLVQILKTIGLTKTEHFDADDERVSSRKRPNIITWVEGDSKERLLIITHLDMVPPGEQALWTETEPFQPTVKDGKIFGRGTEDNLQAMVSSIYAMKALKDSGIKPKRTVGLCFVADEENGSKYGIQHLISKGIFKNDDLVIVPDGGSSDGSFVEIAEKSSLWLKITTLGKQAHASRPKDGLNAMRIGMEFAIALDKTLHQKYSAQDEYFDPPESTFEPTKKEKNVDAINIVPGEDIYYFDCRILPRYDAEQVFKDVLELANEFERRSGAKISVEIDTKTISSNPTKPTDKIVIMLKEALEKTRRIKPRIGGIGGGTCAAYFRKAGVPAVVWSTVDEMAHQPNEYAKIQNMIDDATIFAQLAIM